MKKGLLIIILALVLALLAAGTALAAPADEVWVNGEKMDAANPDEDFGGGHASFAVVEGEAVLTLKGVIIDTVNEIAVSSNQAGILCKSGDLTIRLWGQSKIELAVEGHGIMLENGDLTIAYEEDDPSLIIDVTKNGIVANNGSIFIADSELTVQTGPGPSDWEGIYAGGDVSITNSDVEIKAVAYGIRAGNAIYIGGGSLVDIIEARDYGIYAENSVYLGIDSSWYISGSTVRITSSEFHDDTTAVECGIWALNYMDIYDSTVDIDAGEYGIYSGYSIDIDGSNLDILANGFAIYALGRIWFGDANVYAESMDPTRGNPCAIFSGYTGDPGPDPDDPGITVSGSDILQGGEIVPVYYDEYGEIGGATIDLLKGPEMHVYSGDSAPPPVLVGWTFSDDDDFDFATGHCDGELVYQVDGAAAVVELVWEEDDGTDPSLLLLGLPFLLGGKSFPFVDVPANHWAYDYIFDAYKLNLINGKTPTLYAPDGSLTYAEAIKLAAVIHQLTVDGAVTTKNGGDPWYAPYVAYAELNGIINKGQFSDKYGKAITRYDFALIFSQAMPDGYYTPLHRISGVPDVPSSSPYLPYVLKLYNAGILNGSDAAGNFQGASNVKRSEAAAIVMRMVDPEQRL